MSVPASWYCFIAAGGGQDTRYMDLIDIIVAGRLRIVPASMRQSAPDMWMLVQIL